MLIRTRVLLMALLVTGQFLFVSAQTVEKVTIKSLIGKVQVKSPQSGQWRPARVGMPVRMKWDVRTYVESSVELKFENGTVLKIGENSVIGLSKILQDKNKGISKSNIKVSTGNVWGNVKKLVNKNSSFQFETPTAVAAIRGTILGIGVSNGKTTVDVVEGKVAVRNKGSKKTVLVETGKRAVVKKGNDDIEMTTTEAADPFAGIDTAKVDTTKKDSVATDSTITDSTLIDSLLNDSLRNDSLNTDSTSIDTTGSDLELTIDEPIKGDTVGVAAVVVKGSVSENAKVTINNIQAAVAGGKFSGTVQLTEGDNAIEVFAELGSEQARDIILVVYNPISQDTTEEEVDVELSLSSPSEGDTLVEAFVLVEGNTSEGAEVTVNGVPAIVSGGKYSAKASLLPGNNSIEVIAKLKNSTLTELVNVVFDPPKDLFLSVVVPSKTTNTEIIINGATTPGAEVSIDGNVVSVLPDGSFSYKYLIPDEEGDYPYEIIASYKGKEMEESGSIIYAPEYEEKDLVISELQLKGNRIVISGTASPNAEIDINGFSLKASPDGRFGYEISVSEKDIGDMSVEITATDERTGKEQSTSKTISILATNSAINLSAPKLSMVGQISKATKQGTLDFVATDLTPDDELTLTINNDVNEVESGEVYNYSLSDGKNEITAIVKDLAGNVSNAISDVIYYLPGPLVIEINDPDESMFNIDDLPPMPKNTGALRMDVEIEMDDGIGTTDSEGQILYVKLNGALLQSKGNFRYTGSIAVNRGANNFTITSEDAAGNTAVKQFTVTISE